MKSRTYIILALCLFLIPVQAQQLLDYPLDTINGEIVYRYEVEKSIGLYRVGRNFDVSQSEIVRMNPQLKERGLHYGETLFIPTGYKVGELPAVVHDTVVVVDTIVRVETIVIKDTIALHDSLALPTDTMRVDSIAIDSTQIDTIVDTRRVIELALMLPFESQQTDRSGNAERMMEFYQGALLALHDLQNDSTLYRLRVYDTERSDRRVAELCDTLNHELDSVRGIVGLAYPVQIERMGEWCREHSVPLILPFSDDINLVGNPQLLQFNSTDRQEAQAIAEWISERYTDIHCVLVETKEVETAGIVRELRQQLHKEEIAYTTIGVREVLSDSLFIALDSTKQNLIVLHSDKYNRVRPMLPMVEQSALRGYDILLLGQYSWQKEDIRVPQIYTSVFTSRKNTRAYERLWNAYFQHEHISETPRYDQLGYDLMSQLVYIVNGKRLRHGLQSDIIWKRVGDEGGWQNANVKVVER